MHLVFSHSHPALMKQLNVPIAIAVAMPNHKAYIALSAKASITITHLALVHTTTTKTTN
jgi:hypothetical protein